MTGTDGVQALPSCLPSIAGSDSDSGPLSKSATICAIWTGDYWSSKFWTIVLRIFNILAWHNRKDREAGREKRRTSGR